MAIWFGLMTAAGELAVRAIQRYVMHRYIYLGRDIVWMTPLADVLLFGALAALLFLIAFIARRAVSFRVGASVFATVGALSILNMAPGLTWWAIVALSVGVGTQLARVADAHEPVVMRWMRRSLPPLVALAVCAGVGRTAMTSVAEHRALSGLPNAPASAPNVLVIVWDAVRAQSVSAHGYARPTTPRLAALATRGVSFDRAMATASYTFPSHVSLFTGRWPHEVAASWEHTMDAEVPTLAEAMARRGYRTAAFSANHLFVTWEHKVLRGFSRAEDYVVSPGELARSSALLKWLFSFDGLRPLVGWYDVPGRRNAGDIRTSFLRWLDRDAARPFFAFLNVYDAHAPYLPPEPFDARFAAPGESPDDVKRSRGLAIADPFSLSPAEMDVVRSRYDGAIAATDHDLGLLLDELARRGILDNTLVVVTSDHGDAFGEHRAIGHGHDVFPEVVHVPMVMVLPGRIPAGVRVNGVASLRDVPATIADVTGLAGAGWTLPGASLARLWQPEAIAAAMSDTVLTEVDYLRSGEEDWYQVRRGDVRSVIAWPWQFVTVKDSTALFDLAKDPGARTNLAYRTEWRATHDSLAALLQSRRANATPTKR